jgi:hypothetical protein
MRFGISKVNRVGEVFVVRPHEQGVFAKWASDGCKEA